MVFSNTVFLFIFLPVVFILYCVIPVRSVKNALLTLVSVLFYAYGEPFAVIFMLISVAANYGFGRLMSDRVKCRKIILAVSIAANIAFLGIFKYADFAVDIVNNIFFTDITRPGIALPIGISFFTFQAMSYVIDVYKQPEMIQKNPFKLLFYISFFPQLIAGPIVKYHDFEHQISDRKVTAEKTAQGMRRFTFGLAKKLLIANQMAAAADAVYAFDDQLLAAPAAWLGALAYMMQIYFDFSGYSDMAIGLGKMFGFDFKENFNYPYISSSVTEFWRRWHISVSTWFKEYLYIPLGGNRRGPVRTSVNKVIVFFCTGLWHGASFNFVIWGLLNGVLLLFESWTGLFRNRKIKVLGNIYTLFFTLLAFVIFRADSMGQALSFFRAMFTGFDVSSESMAAVVQLLNPVFIFAFAAAVVFSMPVRKIIEEKAEKVRCRNLLHGASYAAAMILLVICMINLSSATYNPFIYFRF
ncbi:MAG: MBOAT family O-acyltransferase [Porcipelethomonas sp.]